MFKFGAVDEIFDDIFPTRAPEKALRSCALFKHFCVVLSLLLLHMSGVVEGRI
jgi:hypothetical protein